MPVAVAAIASGGLFAAGVKGGVALVAGALAGVAADALQDAMTPDTPDMSQAIDSGAKNLKVASNAARVGIYGETIVSGPIFGYGKEQIGDTEKHIIAIAVADHVCHSATLHHINDEATPESPVDTTATFHLGNQTTADEKLLQIVDGWTANHIGRGLTYARVEIDSTDSRIEGKGINDVTFTVKGKPIYDPRKDSTMGGNGDHRYNEPDTWEWSDNPVLCAFDFMRFHGSKPQTIDRFNLADISYHANICDELVDIEDNNGAQTNEKRYTCNGIFTRDMSPPQVLERILSSCAGEVYRRAGQISIRAGAYQAAGAITVTENDLAGDVKFRPMTPERERINTVRAMIAKGSIETEVPAISNAAYITEDGYKKETSITLHFTDSSTMANRIQKIYLERNRAGFAIELETSVTGLSFGAGDTINIDMDGITAEFKVKSWTYDDKSKKVKTSLLIEQASIYDDDLYRLYETPAFTIPDNTVVATPRNLQIVSVNSGASQANLLWQHDTPHLVSEYAITLTTDSSTQTHTIPGNSTRSLAIADMPAGDYTAAIQAVSKAGKKSQAATLNFTIDTPVAPSNIAIEENNFSIVLTIKESPRPGELYEVQASSTNDQSTAVTIGIGTQFIDHVSANTQRYYWIRTVGQFANSPWVTATGTSTENGEQLVQLLDGKIDTPHLATGLKDSIDTKATQVEVNALTGHTQRIDDAVEQANLRLLESSLNIGETLGIMRDAGVTVDPTTGEVTVQAVESLRTENETQFTNVQMQIDAQDGLIAQSATQAYVNQQIANAQLDPAEFTNFENLELQINNVDLRVDAANGEIAQKADTLTVNGIDVRLDTAETKVSSLESQITQKVSSTQFNAVEERVGTAEQTLNALDVPSITQAVSQTRRNADELEVLSQNNLDELLHEYENRNKFNADIALAREELSAEITDANEAVAQTRTDLIAQIDQTQSSFSSQVDVLAADQSANASQISALQLSMDDETQARINAIQRIDADLNGVKAEYVVALDINGRAIGYRLAASTDSPSSMDFYVDTQRWLHPDTNEALLYFDASTRKLMLNGVGLTLTSQQQDDLRGETPTVTQNSNGSVTISTANGEATIEAGEDAPIPTVTVLAPLNGVARYELDNGAGQSVIISDGEKGDKGDKPLLNIDYFVGDSQYRSVIFKSSSTTPSTPTGGSFNGSTEQIPTGWTDDHPTVTDSNPVWRSNRTYTLNAETNTWTSTAWSSPVKVAERGQDGQNATFPSVTQNTDGSVTIADDSQTIVIPAGQDAVSPTVSQNNDGSVTIDNNGQAFTIPAGADAIPPEVSQNPDGSVVITNDGNTYTIPAGQDADPPTITENADGSVTVESGGNSVTIEQGKDAEPPTITQNADGSVTITDSTQSVTIPAGQDAVSPTISQNSDGSVVISTDGQQFTIPAGADAIPPVVTQNSDGSVTIENDGQTFIIPAGEDATPPTVTQNADGSVTVTSGGQSVTIDKGDKGDTGRRGSERYTVATSTGTWSNSVANGAVDGSPVTGDIVTIYKTSNPAIEDTRRYNGSTWESYTLHVHGNALIEGTLDGSVFKANTRIESPRIDLIGTSFIKVELAQGFGQNNDLWYWFGQKTSATFNYQTQEPILSGMTKSNAREWKDISGSSYFGGSIISGSLANSLATSSHSSTAMVDLGQFGTNGNSILISCGIYMAWENDTGSTTAPPTPTCTIELEEKISGSWISRKTASFTGTASNSYFVEQGTVYGFQAQQLSDSFTYTDNRGGTTDRQYRLKLTARYINTSNTNGAEFSQRLSITTSED